MSTATHTIDVQTCLEHLYQAMNSREHRGISAVFP